MLYARELLNAGRIEDCLEAIDALDADAKENAPPIWQALQRDLPLLRALAYMRMGEEQNCHLRQHGRLLPPSHPGQGVHQKREGATRAIEVLDGICSRSPTTSRRDGC